MSLKILLVLALSLSISHIISQTGPGGVGNSSSNGLWLKANNLQLSDSDPVDIWNDASGNLNNANSTGTTSPVYVSTSSLNNQPVVRFNGINNVLTVLDSDILDDSDGLTYFAVIRPNNLNGSPRPILGKRIGYASSDYAYTWFFFSGNYLNLDINTGNNRFTTSPTSFNNYNNYLLNFVFDGNLSPSLRSNIFSSGSLIKTASETSTSILNSTANLTLGALNSGDPRLLGADYAEIIQYNFALNEAQSIIVHNYLSAKYNIPLTSNDIYNQDDFGYDYDVAGIGQASDGSNHTESQGSGIVRILNPTDLNNNEFLFWGHNNGVLEATETIDIPSYVQARLDRVWRVNETNTFSSSIDVGSIDLRFDLTGLGNVTASDLRLIIDADNDGFFYNEIAISGAVDLGGNIYEFPGVSSIEDNSRFTLGTINVNQTPLPIELIYFHALSDDNKTIKLEWQTASEQENDFFTVERSTNGLEWEIIRIVDGAGNTNTPKSYSTVDNSPYGGNSYYRLKQTDFNGQFKYSDYRKVNLTNSQSVKLNFYPNPTGDIITIINDGIELSDIKIINSSGQDVSSFITVNENQTQKTIIVNMSNLSKGIYYIQAQNQSSSVYKK